MANAEMCFTMLGPRGVGKTSMLVSMYDTIQDELAGAELQLGEDDRTGAILMERLGDLKRAVDETVCSVDEDGGISGDAELREFFFTLGRTGKSPTMTIKFFDFPGGWLHANGNADGLRKVGDICKRATAILIPVDAAPLMEKQGEHNDRVNRPKQICDLIKNAFQDLEEPRLVILAPIRCEKYVQKADDACRLLETVTESYGRLLKFLATPSLRDKVAVVVTPVQTCGCLVFSRFEGGDGGLKLRFRKTVPGAKYHPADCEQPMRYLLKFFVNLHRKRQEWGIFEVFRKALEAVFGEWDPEMIEAGKQFARGLKRDGNGFKILQGEELITG
jgi:hypothetical protein